MLELENNEPTRMQSYYAWLWHHIADRMSKDWIFLTICGIIMALIGFGMDEGIRILIESELKLLCIHYCITLVAKVLGLTIVLGSGMPLGKEGPYVHIASIVANLLSKMATPFRSIYQNESRSNEMLAAACALGLGTCFAAPIGGEFNWPSKRFFFSIIGSTMAVPHGMFIPALKIGSGFGRLMGEFVAWIFPLGVRYGDCMSPIMPAAYALVGAAAFSGSVTHSISVAVVVFEISGQIAFVVPVLVAVLVANAVASLLQPSMYESVIQIKKLPYLPDLLYTNSSMYKKCVEDFMVRDVRYIWQGISYQRLKDVLKRNKKLRSLPLVESPENLILLGSVQRQELSADQLDLESGSNEDLQPTMSPSKRVHLLRQAIEDINSQSFEPSPQQQPADVKPLLAASSDEGVNSTITSGN
ncbi:hypothetical protein KR044_012936, partial [Drosophila immigrans]